jgi:hypothetical protein
MAEAFRPEGQDVGPGLSRRDFVKALGTTALAGSVPSIGLARASAASGPRPTAPAETAVGRFYGSLKDDQRSQICFPVDHPLRSQVANNWAIVRPTINDLHPEQKALCKDVFKNLCSEDGHARFLRQMGEDHGGFERYHVAVFGEPDTDKPFEWVLTGRHATLRADGNSPSGAAFGGPIFYGHASPGPRGGAGRSGSVWWYQAEQAHAVFKTLDDRQRARALVSKAAADERLPVKPRGDRLVEVGLSVSELDGRQKPMVRKLLEDLLRPFRAFDAGEVQECLRDPDGLDKLRLTYFQEGDIGNVGAPDIWKLEGPAFSWYFHGTPHVHVWLNVTGRAPWA